MLSSYQIVSLLFHFEMSQNEVFLEKSIKIFTNLSFAFFKKSIPLIH